MNVMSFGTSVPSILEGDPLLTLRAKGNVEFLSSVRVILTTQIITGNGKLCILICLGVLAMTHLSPGYFSYEKMERLLHERLTMWTTYIQSLGRRTMNLRLVRLVRN